MIRWIDRPNLSVGEEVIILVNVEQGHTQQAIVLLSENPFIHWVETLPPRPRIQAVIELLEPRPINNSYIRFRTTWMERERDMFGFVKRIQWNQGSHHDLAPILAARHLAARHRVTLDVDILDDDLPPYILPPVYQAYIKTMQPPDLDLQALRHIGRIVTEPSFSVVHKPKPIQSPLAIKPRKLIIE